MKIPAPTVTPFSYFRNMEHTIVLRNSRGEVVLSFNKTDDGVIPHDAFYCRKLDGAVFDDLILEGAIFSSCSFKQASFRRADLYWAMFTCENLAGVDFEQALLQGANFADAICRNANFRNVNLDPDNLGGFATFRGADLCGADFTGTNLTKNNFEHAIYDDQTKFPSDFSPSENGLVKKGL